MFEVWLFRLVTPLIIYGTYFRLKNPDPKLPLGLLFPFALFIIGLWIFVETQERKYSHKEEVKEEKKAQVNLPRIEEERKGDNQFPWGTCAWYVAQRRYIPWGENDKSWLANARAFGFRTGSVPRPGAIMVIHRRGRRHVAYVEEVRGNQVVISEMNSTGGLGVKNIAVLPASSRFIKGYMY